MRNATLLLLLVKDSSFDKLTSHKRIEGVENSQSRESNVAGPTTATALHCATKIKTWTESKVQTEIKLRVRTESSN